MPQIRLHVREADGDLPNACMCCGVPATATKTKTLQWCPAWVGVLILVGLLPYVIVALVMTRRARLQAPFCDQHRGHWLNRTLLSLASAFVLGGITIGLLVAAANLPRPQNEEFLPFACIGGVVSFVVWLVILIAAQNTAIRAREITDTEILLDGVSQEFIDIVTEEDRKRRARRRDNRRREDEDDVPHSKAPPSDAIEE